MNLLRPGGCRGEIMPAGWGCSHRNVQTVARASHSVPATAPAMVEGLMALGSAWAPGAWARAARAFASSK